MRDEYRIPKWGRRKTSPFSPLRFMVRCSTFDIRIPATLLLWAICLSAQSSVTIPASPRRIQLDGFLLEWKGSEAKYWRADSTVAWDARCTPEGIAGYFRSRETDSCDAWTFRIYPSLGVGHRFVEMRSDSGADDSLYRVNRTGDAVVCEWLIPWGRVPLDSGGTFRAGMTGFDACGDTLNAELLSGTTRPGSVLTARVKWEFILIAMLLAAYLILRQKASKMAKRARMRK